MYTKTEQAHTQSDTDMKILRMNHNNGDNKHKNTQELRMSLYYIATHNALQHDTFLFVLIVTVVVIHVQNLDICM